MRVEARHLDACHLSVVDIGNQRVTLIIGADAGRGQILSHQHVISRRNRQIFATGRYRAFDGRIIGGCLRHQNFGAHQRVQRGAYIHAKIPGKALDGVDPLGIGLAEPDGQQTLQPRFARRQIRVGIRARRPQCCQMRRLRVAVDRVERRSPHRRVRIGELELHERRTDQPPDPRVRLELFIGFVSDHADLSAIGEIENAQRVAINFFGKDKQAGFFLEPHFLGLPAFENALRLGQTAGGQRVNRGADGLARAFGDDLTMLLQKLLDRGVGVLCHNRLAEHYRSGDCQNSDKPVHVMLPRANRGHKGPRRVIFGSGQ